MSGTLPHGAAHTLAGGGAGALRGTIAEHTLRTAFASGLNTGLLLVRAPGAAGGVTESAPSTLSQKSTSTPGS
ncbi:hypothetical protein [Streptomyces sp. NPDC048282]|uniref:hypothetical protein n=1 Tax=Streptomyces sp. NPDC048282 TaxID=3365528 RepID=UPI0037199289